MKKHIELHARTVEYTLKVSKRARRMRLAIYHDGGLTVTAPYAMHQSLIEQFIIRKAAWIIDKLEYFRKFPGVMPAKGTPRDFSEQKGAALALTERRIGYYNQAYGFAVGKIRIRNQKTRWGSCSRNGNLSFNYRIASLPERLSDYIIVHELCHLREFNHSRKFWELVAQAIPEYSAVRAELRKSTIGQA